MIIRLASQADIAAMHYIRSSVQENRLSNPDRITLADYLPYILAGSCWVAENDSGIVGFAAADLPDRSIWALFVSPQAEGGGIGRLLHHAMISGAAAHGLAELYLSTEAGTRAERFYAGLGWEPLGAGGDGPPGDGELRFRLVLPPPG